MNFSDKTYRALLEEMLSRIPDSFDKRDTSPIPTALSPAAYGLEGFYLALNQVQQSAFIQTSYGQSLDNLAVIGGLSRYPASAAVRLGLFNIAPPVGARFSTINGPDSINFTVTAILGSTQAQLTAETPGTVGNEYAGTILPITPVPGLTSAQLTDILIPGDDTETEDALRQRLITALNDRPFAGNIAAYRQDILAMDGVGAVQVWPTWDGGGTVKCSLLGADFLPASAALVQQVQNAVDPPEGSGAGLGLAPIGAKVTIASPQAVEVNIAATVTLASGYELGQVQPLAEAAIAAYLLEVRRAWDTQLGTTQVEYAADIYLARILAAIVGAQGVVNISDVTINGKEEDLFLTETGQTQQAPVLGTVTLHES